MIVFLIVSYYIDLAFSYFLEEILESQIDFARIGRENFGIDPTHHIIVSKFFYTHVTDPMCVLQQLITLYKT